MEMEPSPHPDPPESAEPEQSSRPPSYKDAQVWRDLEAETGFASCADYLQCYKDVRPDFRDRLDDFSIYPIDRKQAIPIVIYDISKKDNLPMNLNFRRQSRSGTELIQALRQPPANVCVQLVLWPFEYNSVSQEMADALILGLKLDPQFLDDLDVMLKHAPRTRQPFGDSLIKDVFGYDAIATILQDFMPKVSDSVPVLLVAYPRTEDYREDTFEGILADIFRRNRRKPPLRRSAIEESRPLVEVGSVARAGREQLYARIVEDFIVQGRSATPSKAFQMLAAAWPLVYVEASRVREALDSIRRTYDALVKDKLWSDEKLDGTYKNLDRKRLNLRRTLEEAEDRVSQILRYLGSELNLDMSKEPSYTSIEADWRSLNDEARRLEADVRDYMQLQVGNLSLEESRRSIEISNLQIREAKSVKVFTILAFIYVPLNLATSIFGMNIQQLNGSGQKLWVFFTTAIAALLLTGGSWLCSNRLMTHDAVAWYKECAAAKRVNDKEGKRKYGLLLRMAMLLWLVRNGHRAWMWETGAWRAILLNSDVAGETIFGNQPPACEYVANFGPTSDDNDFRFTYPLFDELHWSPIWGSKKSAVPRPSFQAL